MNERYIIDEAIQQTSNQYPPASQSLVSYQQATLVKDDICRMLSGEPPVNEVLQNWDIMLSPSSDRTYVVGFEINSLFTEFGKVSLSFYDANGALIETPVSLNNIQCIAHINFNEENVNQMAEIIFEDYHPSDIKTIYNENTRCQNVAFVPIDTIPALSDIFQNDNLNFDGGNIGDDDIGDNR